jgi:hypothetical protein
MAARLGTSRIRLVVPHSAGPHRAERILRMTAQQVYQAVGTDSDVIRALVRAEKYGQAIVHGATIIFQRYADGAREFCAATALYAVRW